MQKGRDLEENGFDSGSEARAGVGWWVDFYNERRPHSSLDDRTPEETYTDDGAARRPGFV